MRKAWRGTRSPCDGRRGQDGNAHVAEAWSRVAGRSEDIERALDVLFM